MGRRINVLVTGAGAPGGPGVLKALCKCDQLNVSAVDANKRASGRFLIQDFSEIPVATSENFLPNILEICRQKSIDVLLPLVTKELFVLSENIKEFEQQGTRVVVPKLEDLEILNDKGKLLNKLDRNKIKTPKFRVVNETSELDETVKSLGFPDNPVVIKPCIGNGSRGVRIIDNSIDRYELLFNKKPTTLYSSYQDYKSAIAGREIPQLVVTEYLPGEEITVDVVANQGKAAIVLVRSRDSMNSGISTSGRFISLPEVETYVSQILDCFPELNGPIGFQFKKSKSGEYLLIESNPRIQGTSVAGLGVGINIPLISVLGKVEIPENYKKNISEKIGFVRYYEEAFFRY